MFQLLAQTRDFDLGREELGKVTDCVASLPFNIKILCRERVTDVATIKGLETIFYNLVAVSLALAGIVLFIMLLVGGFKYLTAGDNADQAQSARQTLTYGFLGFILIVAAFLILKLIEQFTGVPVTIFKVTN